MLSGQRAELMRIIRDETNEEAKTLGIEIVDLALEFFVVADQALGYFQHV